MTQLLERAVDEIRHLPDAQQNEIAERLLHELEDAKWDALLARPEAKAKLREMAAKARENYDAGLSTPIVSNEMG
jgi:hypothetical protein